MACLTIASVSAPLSSTFAVTSDGCSSQILTPAATCDIDLDFLPPEAGFFADQISIASDDPGEPQVEVDRGGEGTGTGGGTSPDTLAIDSESITTSQTFEACTSLTIGPGVEILSPADVVLRAGQSVEFVAEVSVATGASLTVEIDPALLP